MSYSCGLGANLWNTKIAPEVDLMPAPALRLSDRQLKGVKLNWPKDFVLTDGDRLQLRVRSNGSLLWNFNYREPVTKSVSTSASGPTLSYPWRTLGKRTSRPANCLPRASTPRCIAIPSMKPGAPKPSIPSRTSPSPSSSSRRTQSPPPTPKTFGTRSRCTCCRA